MLRNDESAPGRSPSGGSTNPFATRYVRPGAIDYIFPAGVAAAQLVENLCANGWQGQIIGPHGSGKSTLIAALAPHLARAGRTVVTRCLRAPERKFPLGKEDLRFPDANGLAVIDGFEQLSPFQRWKGMRLLRKNDCGLLATAHTSVGLPMIYETRPTIELALRIVVALASVAPIAVTPDDVRRLFHEQAGNLREVLFGLYDVQACASPVGRAEHELGTGSFFPRSAG